MNVTLKKLSLFALLFVFTSSIGISQTEDDSKKIIVVKTTINEDGSETIETITTDKEAKGGENVNVSVDGDFIKIIVDGEETIVNTKETSINIDLSDDLNKVLMKIEKDGKLKVIEWKNEGDIPVDIQEQLDELGIDIETIGQDIDVDVEKILMHIDTDTDGPTLGITGKITLTDESDINETKLSNYLKEMPTVIDRIITGSTAEYAGLKSGDLITKLGSTPIKTFDDIDVFLSDKEIGDEIKITYERDGKTITTTATLKKIKK